MDLTRIHGRFTSSGRMELAAIRYSECGATARSNFYATVIADCDSLTSVLYHMSCLALVHCSVASFTRVVGMSRNFCISNIS